MDLMIYDEELDRHVHITALSALAASCYGVENGPNQLPDTGADSDLFNIKNFKNDSPAGQNYANSCSKAGAAAVPKDTSQQPAPMNTLEKVLDEYKRKLGTPSQSGRYP